MTGDFKKPRVIFQVYLPSHGEALSQRDTEKHKFSLQKLTVQWNQKIKFYVNWR
jgi:hypothetical protein